MAMRELLQYTIWAMLTLLLMAGSTGQSFLFGQEPEIQVQVDRNKVFEGESLTYAILLNLVDKPTRPDLSHLTDFAVEPAGEKELNSQSITIINGVRTEVVQKGTQYLYKLTPKSSGDLIIPAPTVTVGGMTIEGKPIKIQVKAIENQDLVKLEMSVDRPTVYMAQEFTLKLKVFVKALPDPNSDQDPLSIQRDPPSLTVSWLDEDQLPDSLTAKQSLNEVLQKLVSQRGNGFGINGYRDSSIFSMLDQTSLAFHPRPKVIKSKDATDNEVTYWTYEFSRTFSATKPGQYQFIPVTLKGTFGKTINRGRLLGEDVFAKSNAVEVQVLDAPLDGRPDSYIGAIGAFTVVSELSPTTARVGDPLTLAITLKGKGLLSDAQPPKLDSIAEINAGFKVYEGTSETDERGKRFTYSLRPLSSSVKQLPEIPVTYFDVQQEKYVTLKTAPIDITVAEAERLNASSVVSNSSGASADSTLTQIAGGMVGNYTDLASLSDDRYSPSFFVVVWVAMFGLALFAHAWIGLAKKRSANPQANRQRTALTRARALLADAEKLRMDSSATQNSTQTIDLLRRALVGLVADYANVSAEGLSIGDVDEKLAQFGATEELRSQVRSFLDSCDAARFSSGSKDATSMSNQAESLVSRIGQALADKVPKAFLLLVVCMLLSGCGASVSEQASKAFLETTQQFEAAQTEKEFFKVALRYQQILEGGYVCGPILFNQGNAWLRAGETGRAIACYRKALRYRPRDPLVQTNLAHAQSTIPNLPRDKGKTVFEYIYFWRDWLSLREKLTIETVLIGLTLLCSVLGWRGSKFRALTAAFVVGSLLFGITCVLDYRDQYATQHGVVVSQAVVARKGNGDGFDPAFSGELPEGSEFTVVDRKRDWLQIEVEGLGRGWLREESVQLY